MPVIELVEVLFKYPRVTVCLPPGLLPLAPCPLLMHTSIMPRYNSKSQSQFHFRRPLGVCQRLS